MGLPGPTELLIILGIVVILFGGKKIPELMKGLGSGIKNFKNAVKDDEKETPVAVDETKKVEATQTAQAADAPKKAEETPKQA